MDPLVVARFAAAATEVIELAQVEARSLGQTQVCTEHLLLALLRRGDGVAGRALGSCEVTLARFHARLEEIWPELRIGRRRPNDSIEGEVPLSALTPRTPNPPRTPAQMTTRPGDRATAAPRRGCRIKASRRWWPTLAVAGARAAVCDDAHTDDPRATDGLANFGARP